MMSLLQQYQEAATWLASAAEECQKTSNVDLQHLITSCENCKMLVGRVKEMDTNAIRQAALQQLDITLNDHLEILRAKKDQLDAGGETSNKRKQQKDEKTDARSTDTHSQSRTLAIEDTIVRKGTVSFSDVAGLTQAKQILREAIVMPLQYPQLFTGARKPWKRILLYGPPGTGKSRLAQAVSSEISSTFYCVSSSDLVSSWVGESEKLIKELFVHATQQEGRSVIFIDEIDSICRIRSSREEEHTRRIKTELLRQMESADNGRESEQFFLLCATNRPWELDTAFLRRFQKRVYVPLPDREARIAILKIHASCNLTLSDSDIQAFADRTEGYSGSDLSNVILTALFEPIRDIQTATHWMKGIDGKFTPCDDDTPGCIQTTMSEIQSDRVKPRDVTLSDFILALQSCHRIVTADELKQFEAFTSHFGQTG
ncbi:vacuolar protein sorting-associated protein 4-like isoform X2 [Acanthaster planci]|uniref:Vacuolar protein sorting-associated protein 4-like isoform X2 n=1 Tax=Acanthaster planci TaxID=133434 RepID=A0A8B7Y3Y0_ACAPL|nr:vacuolar protein sorting-associated protein 4-like isoform X2 [Acanthaster planci]